jgi:antitoxin HigA-1
MSQLKWKSPIITERGNFMNNMRAIHPGEIIREEYLKPLGMSANALATALRVSAPRINDIVREKRGISVDTALRLARYFNTTAQFWLNLQTSYDLKVAQKNIEVIQQEVLPLRVA